MRARLILLGAVLVVALIFLIWYFRSTKQATESPASTASSQPPAGSGISPTVNGTVTSSDFAPTDVYAHKLNGTLHRIVPAPIELIGSIAATSDNRIQVHLQRSVVRSRSCPLSGTAGERL